MPVTFRDLIASNKRNSVLLVLGFIVFVMVVAMILGQAIIYLNAPQSEISWTRSLLIGVGAGIVSLLISLVSYYTGDKMVLAASGARPITHAEDPQLFNVVEEMAIAAGVPMPQVYKIDDVALNAFATGRDPQHASIAITTGLRDKLNREELQGVIAHEMSHVRNFDIRLMLLLAVLVGTVVMLADFFWQFLRWGAFSRSSTRSSRTDRDGRNDKDSGGIIMLVVFVLAVILALIAPLLAQIIQLAVSRQREYLADASGVELTRNPLGLASALRKIDDDPHELKNANRGTAHLFIDNPVEKFRARSSSLLASHPPIEDRIARLEALAHAQQA